MGTGDSVDLGTVLAPSRGRKMSFATPSRARSKVARDALGNSSRGGCAKTRQIKNQINAGARMSKLLRKPDAILWVLSISQAAAMLALNLLLRVAVS